MVVIVSSSDRENLLVLYVVSYVNYVAIPTKTICLYTIGRATDLRFTCREGFESWLGTIA